MKRLTFTDSPRRFIDLVLAVLDRGRVALIVVYSRHSFPLALYLEYTAKTFLDPIQFLT